MNIRMLKVIRNMIAESGNLSVYEIRDKMIDMGYRSIPSVTELTYFMKKFFRRTGNNEWTDEDETI